MSHIPLKKPPKNPGPQKPGPGPNPGPPGGPQPGPPQPSPGPKPGPPGPPGPIINAAPCSDLGESELSLPRNCNSHRQERGSPASMYICSPPNNNIKLDLLIISVTFFIKTEESDDVCVYIMYIQICEQEFICVSKRQYGGFLSK
ncbi:hypothetical protein Ancab_019353 [Ancistrocladus abbreviatus]